MIDRIEMSREQFEECFPVMNGFTLPDCCDSILLEILSVRSGKETELYREGMLVISARKFHAYRRNQWQFSITLRNIAVFSYPENLLKKEN